VADLWQAKGMSKEIANAYRISGEKFVALAKSLSESQMNTAPENGEWSPAYIVHHMADAEAFFTTRFMRILSEENPTIEPFDEEVFPARLNYAERSAKASLALIEGARIASADLLDSLDAQAWNRKGTHSERGEFPLHAAVALATGHIEAHQRQLEETLKG